METKPVLPTLAALITERRDVLGLTNDDELIAATGRHQTTVSGWGRGRGWPSIAVYGAVAEWLDIPYEFLVEVIVAEHIVAGKRFRRPRVPAADVPEIPDEVGRLSAALARIGKQVSALRQRVDDLELRVDDLAKRVAAQSPGPGPAVGRRGSKK